jgi:type I restriction enzyme S subunit
VNPEQLLAHFDRISEAPDAIPRLRRFILDLAVRGKLVEQDPRDDPASKLLKRIQEEKVRLVKTGEIKKLETFEPVEVHEIPFTIPSGWEVIRMGWLARKLGAGSTPLGGKSVYQSEGVPFLRSQNVHDDGLRLDDVALISRSIHERMSGTHVQHNDMLLNITGASIGRCALVPSNFVEGNVSQHVAIIRLFFSDIRQFIHLSLTSPFFQKVIDDVQVGVSREGLSMQRLRFFPMLLAPLAEQRRIVAKVDELMALCDRLEASQAERESQRDRLAAASLHRLNNGASADAFREHTRFTLDNLPRLTTRREHIQQLRQTILNLAVHGKLVLQDPNDEPAAELLKRIQADKERCIKDGQVKKDGLLPQVRGEEAWFEVPEGWSWVRLGTIAQILMGQSPPGHTYNKTGDGLPLINGPVEFTEGPFGKTVVNQYTNAPKNLCEEGDLLLCVRGSTTGRTNIAGFRACIGRGVAAIRPFCPDEYVRLFIWRLRESIIAMGRGIAFPSVTRRQIEGLPVPLPPLAEQNRIVAKVEELMALCNQLEAQLTTTKTESRSLLESTLHYALSA